MRRLLITLSTCALLLSGCSWLNDDEGMFVDRSDDYLDSKPQPAVQFPEDMAAQQPADPFPIPTIPTPSNPQYFPDRPPLPSALYADDSRREVRLQRIGARQWLVVPEPPTTVWPKLKQFLAENGMSVVSETPAEGRIDTSWFDVTDSGTYRDVVRVVLQEELREASAIDAGRERLRIRLEQGLQADTSEIHLRHENDGLALPSEDRVVSLTPLSSAVPAAEAQLLNELGAYIASRVSEQTVSKVATNIASAAKASITRNVDGEPVLRLLLDRERAWAAIGRALENGSVDILERRTDDAVYDVRVADVLFSGEEEPGFFGRLFRGREDSYDLSLRLIGGAEQHELSVHDADGAYADRQLSQDVLSLVRDFAG